MRQGQGAGNGLGLAVVGQHCRLGVGGVQGVVVVVPVEAVRVPHLDWGYGGERVGWWQLL